jgi:uncharacterized metal-binding protein/predicted Fe-Mo cluster-binding NifX family protein
VRYAIPLLTNRISPRCTIAEALLIVEVCEGEVKQELVVPSPGGSWTELVSLLTAESVDVLVCGGISREARQELQDNRIGVVENVATTVETVIGAICTDRLRPGLGFGDHEIPQTRPVQRGENGVSDRTASRATASGSAPVSPVLPDCLRCAERICLRGRPCDLLAEEAARQPRGDARRMLEATLDISAEDERVLCRLTELVYFGLEMGYRRLGIAFCWDLQEPTRILVGVLRRFFEVVPVSCKIGGLRLSSPADAGAEASRRPADGIACNPRAQARALDAAGCDLNVMVGLCMGADCLFMRTSRAPVTTLFVKDRSLANNPIGALYSERYLQEAMRVSVTA